MKVSKVTMFFIIIAALFIGAAKNCVSETFGLFGLSESGTLYWIDDFTGKTVRVGQDGTLQGCSCMDYNPADKTLYGTCESAAGFMNDNSGKLIIINSFTGGVSTYKSFNIQLGGDVTGFFNSIGDISFKSNGILSAYLASNDSEVKNDVGERVDALGTIDLNSGLTSITNQITPIGSSGVQHAIAFSKSDVLYIFRSELPFENSRMTNQGSSFSNQVWSLTGGDGTPRIVSMDTNPATGALYGLVTNGGSSCCIADLNILSRSATIIASINKTDLKAIAWVPSIELKKDVDLKLDTLSTELRRTLLEDHSHLSNKCPETTTKRIFLIIAKFTNISQKNFVNMHFVVDKLTGNNTVINVNPGESGTEGSIIRLPTIPGVGIEDCILNAGESFTAIISICLEPVAPFSFFVKAFGNPIEDGMCQ
ncbi:MAG: hypothetical protein MRK02_07145 [Candidatus Scalindua sp.]|nr:hypothetical protein [Candidatus Scalindua sp.]